MTTDNTLSIQAVNAREAARQIGGQFGAQQHTAPDSTLNPKPAPVTIPVVKVFTLDTARSKELPEFPAELGEPRIAWGLSDDTGDTFISVSVGEGDNERDAIMWVGWDGDMYTQVDGGGLRDDTKYDQVDSDGIHNDHDISDRFETWGHAVLQRVHDSRESIQHQIFNPEIEAAVLAHALGNTPQTPAARFDVDSLTDREAADLMNQLRSRTATVGATVDRGEVQYRLFEEPDFYGMDEATIREGVELYGSETAFVEAVTDTDAWMKLDEIDDRFERHLQESIEDGIAEAIQSKKELNFEKQVAEEGR